MPLIKIQRHCLGDIRRIRKFITNFRHLSLHEHQCKTLLRENGCTIQDFFVAGTSEELETNFKNKGLFFELCYYNFVSHSSNF